MTGPVTSLIVLIALLLASCNTDEVRFRNKVNGLTPYSLEGDYAMNIAEEDTSYTDTISIHRLKKNIFTILTKRDTLYHGEIVRKRGMYFLNKPAGDNCWHIGVFRINGDSAQGFYEAIWLENPADVEAKFESISKSRDPKGHYIYTVENKKQETIDAYRELADSARVLHFASLERKWQRKEAEPKEEIEAAVRTMSVFPNPFYRSITVQMEEQSEWQLRMINASGKIVNEMKFSGTKTDWDLGSLPRGAYVLESRSASGLFRTMKLIRE